MSKTNAMENSWLLLVFHNIDFAKIGAAAGLQNSAADGSLYVSLHTADPGEAGDQTTNETSYTGYARVAVARGSGGGWTVTNDTVTNAGEVLFGACTAGSATITHFGIGASSSGAGLLMYSGALTGSLAVSAGIQPYFAADQISVVEA